jgi:hypothetical protein
MYGAFYNPTPNPFETVPDKSFLLPARRHNKRLVACAKERVVTQIRNKRSTEIKAAVPAVLGATKHEPYI